MIKVLHLISSFRKGGTERQLSNLLKSASKDDIVHLAYSSVDHQPSYLDEFDLHQLVTIGNGATYSNIKKAVEETKPDVVVAWSYKESIWGLLSCILKGIPYINASIKHGLFQGRRKDYIRKIFIHLSRHRIANSRAGLRVNGVKKGDVVYNGIDQNFFINIRRDQKREPESEKIHILSVGSLSKIKDYPTILRALAQFKGQFEYTILGDGPEKLHLIEMSKDLGILNSVHFPGNGQNVKDNLLKSDIFIHASRGEGCCNAILEAMASGLPVIASATGGTPEIVPEGKGFLFSAGNDEELARYVDSLMASEEQRLRIGRAAHEYALNEFTIEQFVNKYNSIIQQVSKTG